jgi:hypothetical protein
MKKNFLTAAAIMVTAFFVGTEVAKAADVTFSGQIRTRYEVNEQSDFTDTTEADDFTSTRVRLNANVNVNDSTSAFIQMQSVRTWGQNIEAANTTNGGSGNASTTPSDADASVGVHQAYFTLKNFATLPVDLQLGRQEVVLDGHRLFGNTGWTQGAQTHDAIRLTHKHDNMTLLYAWINVNEDGTPTGTNVNDRNDVESHLVYFQYAGLLGGNFSITYNWLQDGCGITGACDNLANDSHTIGFRQAGQLYGIDYRGEYYHQFGDANSAGSAWTAGTAGGDIDRDAYMFGIRVGKAFNNVMMKPGLTVWYDYLSGTSDEDARDNDYGGFNTLFDTGHKFYGFMDLFLAAGAGGRDAATRGLGLQDFAVKANLSPMNGWILKADYHWFYTAEGVSNTNVSGRALAAADRHDENDLGNELDVTLINKYNANTNISIGYSNYSSTSAFRTLRATGGDDANWAYVMFDVKF